MKKLFIYLLSLCSIVSCLQEERSPEEILVPSPAQVECSDASSLLLTSKVPKKSENLVDECGFYYSTDESMAHAVKVEASMDVNNFAAELPERNYGTTYYICSYVTNGHGSEIRSEVSSYNLKALDKYIQFEPIELLSYNKAETSAEVTFEVEIWSGVNVSEIGVCFGVTTSPSTEGRHVKGNLTDDGLVLASLPNFLTDKEYYLRAYVRDGDYTAYGEITPLTIKLFPPTLSSVIVSSVKSSSATFSSAVTDDGGDKITEVGFYYSTDESVDPETSFKVNQVYTSESFSLESTNLQANTNYYVKSFAVNSVGVAYSEVASFMTAPGAPQVATLEATDVTESSAVLSGNIISDNGAKITERGFVWLKGMDVPTVESNKLKAEGTTGEFTAILSDIEPNQKYSFRAYAINSEGTTYGDVMTFTTSITNASLSSVIVSDITSTSATLSSKVSGHGGETVSEVGFYYSTEETVDPAKSQKVNRTYSSDSFSISISGLSINTKYYVKAYAVNSAGTVYSEIESFTTLASTPVVNTTGSSEVTSDSAVLTGKVVTDNGAAITERGFVWLKGSDAPTTSSNKVKVEGTIGDFTATLSDLEPNQKYSFRAYAVNSVGTSYGDVMYFTTVAGRPTLSVTKVTDITETSATFTSKVTSDGGSTPTEVGFYYSKEESVNVETAQKVSEAFSSDNFTLSVSDLEVGTSYYVKAFALNSTGEAYNDIVSFKTVSTAPSVQTTDASDISSSGAMLSGEVLDDNGEPISERGFVWIKGQGTPAASSNKVNVDGTTGEYSATISGLEPNQTYSYRAYAANSKGTAYGETKSFVTLVALPEVEYLSASDITSSSAVVTAKVTAHGGETVSEVGFLYGTTSSLDPSTASRVTSAYNIDSFSFTLDNLSRATEYYVRPFATNSAGTSYGETMSFTTLPELPVVSTMDVIEITDNSAVCGGVITDDGNGEIIAKGVVWSRSKNPTAESFFKTEEGSGKSSYTSYLTDLTPGSTYYVCAYAVNAAGISYGEELVFTTTGEALYQVLESANCFIVSESGTYSFKTVKGNSLESVGSVASAEVLWESFGTDEVPDEGSLVSSVSLQGDAIVFDVADPYREGNAVIAAKDASGTVLWSWHIWLTDQPEEHVYNNNAGTMMDRNLGATSATPGDVGALCLLYQWGRKDPFLSGSTINSWGQEAKSTITWPPSVSSNSSTGTIDYAISNPTTYIKYNSNNRDWYYTGTSDTDNTRWTTSERGKSIYDPCPAGWRVPDGGSEGIWSKAGFSGTTFDRTNKGISFSINSPSTTWYPASGFRSYSSGALSDVGQYGHYWSATPINNAAYYLYFYNGSVYPSNSSQRADGFAVRCLQE